MSKHLKNIETSARSLGYFLLSKSLENLSEQDKIKFLKSTVGEISSSDIRLFDEHLQSLVVSLYTEK